MMISSISDLSDYDGVGVLVNALQVVKHGIPERNVRLGGEFVECKLDLGSQSLGSKVARLHVLLVMQQLIGSLPCKNLPNKQIISENQTLTKTVPGKRTRQRPESGHPCDKQTDKHNKQ